LPFKSRFFDTNLSQLKARVRPVDNKLVVDKNLFEPETGAEMLKFKSLVAAIGLSAVAATTWAADITGAGAT
jgi:hypothetical protein